MHWRILVNAYRFDRVVRAPGFWLVLVLCVTVLAVGVLAAPQSSPFGRNFVGYWQGVDVLDGSTVHVSLSDIDADGVLELRQQEGFYTICFNQGPGFSQGRGFIRGSGRATARQVLALDTQLFCVSDDNVAMPLLDERVEYTLSSDGQILQLPQFDDNPRVLLHRTSS
jgi:hypothetical protein